MNVMIKVKNVSILILVAMFLTGCQTGDGPIANILNSFGTCVGETPEQIENCE
ncbi:MAG: hypothetical protein OXE41_02005 [Gammaproteobacteria bacterium]|nr:hypothetical protein [Gammaproteobacteria bacterium]MCY4217843.1 hypothetical protein [Gammaproteobacteria bacterium]MCY4274162.1 hypothetical protein [Gammaproteobacteria bacterium]